MEKEDVDLIKWFSEITNKDVSIAGGKGASLGEMYGIKMPIPPGFVVTAQAYAYFIEKAEIGVKMDEALSKLDVDDTDSLNKVSKEVRCIIEDAELPENLKSEIVEAYGILGVEKKTDYGISSENNAADVLEKKGEPYVAIRSSATTEDLVDASFAGQQESFLNIKGERDLLVTVKKCMSSLFTARAIYYRTKKGFKHNEALLSVVIQKMIDSKKSGVMFSNNPTSNDGRIVIEAVWGLGEGIVSGQIKPDHYEIDPNVNDFEIIKKQIFHKKIAIIRGDNGHTKTVKLEEEISGKQVLDKYEMKRLAQYAKKLEAHYEKPQDIEFAIDNTGIYIVQSRPITTIANKKTSAIKGDAILTGLAASPGVGSGKVKIVHDLNELSKIEKGDILVTEMTNPDMVVSMERANAIITDEGGITSHAAIVSREMGIPAVVGTGEATSKLKEGEVVTVDGNSGKIIEGKSEKQEIEIKEKIPTKIEIKVIVDLPNFAERAVKSGAKAVGLTRMEGVIAKEGKHPYYFVQKKNMNEYIKIISKGIKEIAEHFEKIWVRTSDLRSDEYSNLEGAPKGEEMNPMLGDHGIRFSLKHPEIMKAELEAFKEAAISFPDKEFGIMIPQVISVEDIRSTKRLAKEVKLPQNVKIGIMVETPAAVQIINDLLAEGVDFISFGTNDLTQYTLAIDRNNKNVQHLYTALHPAILNSLRYVIRRCKKNNVITSICGQAGSNPEMAKFLVAEGINSISVNADAALKVSKVVAEAEKIKFKENLSLGKETSVEDKCPDKDKNKIEVSQKLKESQVIEKKSSNSIEDSKVKLYDEDNNPDDEPKSGEPAQIPVIGGENYLVNDKEIEKNIEEEILKALDGEKKESSSINRNKNENSSPVPISPEMIESEVEKEAVEELAEEWGGEKE